MSKHVSKLSTMSAATLCDSVNALAALREPLLSSHQPIKIVDVPRVRNFDTILFLSSVEAHGDPEYVALMPAAPGHVHSPGLGRILHHFAGQVTAASEFGTVVIAANAAAQAQAATRDSHDGYLVWQRLHMPAGHRRGGSKALESVM